MKIGLLTRSTSCEYLMQDELEAWLIKKKIPFLREVHVKASRRRADFFIYYDNKLINIEAKSTVTEKLMSQTRSHAKYCDYSFVYLPDYTLTPMWFKIALTETGFGVFIFNYESKAITEVFEAHCNIPQDQVSRRIIIDKIKKECLTY